MALITKVDLGVPRPLDLKDYKPSFGELFSHAFKIGIEANPVQALKRNMKMSGLDEMGWSIPESSAESLDPANELDFEEFQNQRELTAVPIEEQEKQFRDAGLEHQLKPVQGYNQQALDIIIENKRLENAMGVLNQNVSGAKSLTASLAGGLVAGFLDPINVASCFVPVLPEARIMSIMANAGGMAARAGHRLWMGAASGAAGAALLEPMIYLGQQEIQADYTLANSLQNLFIGSVMGAGLHTAGGTFMEWRRAKKGAPQPWEYVPEDYNSEALREAHAEEIYQARMEAEPNADPEKTRMQSEDDARLFDAMARNWAYHEKKKVGDFYQQYKPEWRSWLDGDFWRKPLPEEFRLGRSEAEELGWIGRDYEGLKSLNADAMKLPEFMEQLDLWQERFPDLHDYEGIRQAIANAKPVRKVDAAGSEVLHQLEKSATALAITDDNYINFFSNRLKAQENLTREIGKWNKVVDNLPETAGGTSNPVKMLGQTPLVLELVGRDNKTGQTPGQGGIYATSHLLDRHHPQISKDVLKKIPRALVDPIAIFDSETRPGSLIFMLEVKDTDGATVIVPLALEANRKDLRKLDANIAVTAYGKKEKGGINKGWFERQLKKNARYINEEKIKRWQLDARVQFPVVSHSNASGNKIFTFSDLVNFEINKNTTLYQISSSPAGKDGTARTLFQDEDAPPVPLLDPVPGKATKILGQNLKENARYELRELDTVIASHDPENGFARREDYPAIAQERPYHSDPGEQQKVRDNALAYEPGFVVSTDASASNGPPIITENGIVLGGNSRTMTLQTVYANHPEKAQAYRQALLDNADTFGIQPEAIEWMEKPILVRVVEGEMTPEQMAKRSREYNQSTTQQLQGEAEGVSRARFINQNVIDALSKGVKDGRTIGEFLASPDSAEFAITLLDAGVLQKNEMAALTHSKTGQSGKLGQKKNLVLENFFTTMRLAGKLVLSWALWFVRM